MMNRLTPISRLLSTPWLRSPALLGLVSSVGLASTLGIVGAAPLLAQSTVDSLGGTAPTAVEPAPTAPQAPPVVSPEVPLPSMPHPTVVPPAPVSNPAPATSTAPLSVPSDESYIDSTGYSVGATNRSRDLSSPVAGLGRGTLPSIPNAVQVGPVSVSSYGLGIGELPSVKDFYRRTLRPPGQLGNGNIQLIFPLSIPAPITSVFGWRIHPLFETARFHTGTDLGAPMGTPVLAAYAGKVALADFLGGYGLAIALDHNKGTQQTLYGHLSEIFVKAGDVVKQGEVIGRVGSTGNSTGPHLHFEFRQLTPDGWVAMDAGSQLEYSLAQLVKFMEVSEKGIASAQGLQVSQQGLAGVSGAIEWQAQTPSQAQSQLRSKAAQPLRPANITKGTSTILPNHDVN